MDSKSRTRVFVARKFHASHAEEVHGRPSWLRVTGLPAQAHLPSPVGYDPQVVAIHLSRVSRRTFLAGAVALSAHMQLTGPAEFDARDRSVVISGDTAPSQNLEKLAAGADVLVHSVMYPPAIDRLVARVPNAAALKASILAHQTSAEDAGRLAQHAGVKTLVLSHFVPPDDAAITDTMWREAALRHFRGTVIVGRDLLEI